MKLKRSVVWAIMLVATAGCSTLAPLSPEQVVADRAQQRVDFLMAGEHERSYEFTTPGYRSTENPGQYGTRWAGTGMWLGASVHSVDCIGEAPEVCKVVLDVSYRAMQFGTQNTKLSEEWVRIGGEWYFVQKF